MQINDYLELIRSGEQFHVEFKESRNSLSRSVFETICAFLNRKGGYLILGVDDNRLVVGVEESTIQNQIDTLARDLNNPQLISPTITLFPEIIEIEGKKVIVFYGPRELSAA